MEEREVIIANQSLGFVRTLFPPERNERLYALSDICRCVFPFSSSSRITDNASRKLKKMNEPPVRVEGNKTLLFVTGKGIVYLLWLSFLESKVTEKGSVILAGMVETSCLSLASHGVGAREGEVHEQQPQQQPQQPQQEPLQPQQPQPQSQPQSQHHHPPQQQSSPPPQQQTCSQQPHLQAKQKTKTKQQQIPNSNPSYGFHSHFPVSPPPNPFISQDSKSTPSPSYSSLYPSPHLSSLPPPNPPSPSPSPSSSPYPPSSMSPSFSSPSSPSPLSSPFPQFTSPSPPPKRTKREFTTPQTRQPAKRKRKVLLEDVKEFVEKGTKEAQYFWEDLYFYVFERFKPDPWKVAHAFEAKTREESFRQLSKIPPFTEFLRAPSFYKGLLRSERAGRANGEKKGGEGGGGRGGDGSNPNHDTNGANLNLTHNKK